MSTHPVISPKKLIEVALPLDAINAAAAREKSIRHGHPSTLHLWWARRPLAAARAVIFSQLVHDPEDLWRHQNPGQEPSKQVKGHWTKARAKLFAIIEDLVKWENTTNETVLNRAREEIRKSWRETCELNRAHPQAQELFDPEKMPGLHDPFAGGGAIPLEAQRLGLEAYASDLNPVAVLINKAMIEIPPKFAGRPPVCLHAQTEDGLPRPSSHERVVAGAEAGREQGESGDDAPPASDAPVGSRASPGHRRGNASKPNEPSGAALPQPPSLFGEYHGARGLAADVRFYGQWMREEAFKRIGHLYPPVQITAEMTAERPDLEPYLGRKLTVIAWLWARTVHSPNPAFSHVEVPLASTFVLSSKPGKEAYVEPVIGPDGYRFTVKVGKPPAEAKAGTKAARGSNFRCLLSGSPISANYIMTEAKQRGLGTRLLAVVVEGTRSRVYLPPEAPVPVPETMPDLSFLELDMTNDRRWFSPPLYGMPQWKDIFTARQLVALTTFSDLVGEARERIRHDGLAAGLPDDDTPLDQCGTGARAYAEAVSVYLACVVDKLAESHSTLCTWSNAPKNELVVSTFRRQALPMTWDFGEANAFADSSGSIAKVTLAEVQTLQTSLPAMMAGHSSQARAQSGCQAWRQFVSTDPPYYDNIGYADLSDYFYVWLRRSLRLAYRNLFATVAVPKEDELVATPNRHGTRQNAEIFFLDGMSEAMHNLAGRVHPSAPITIYYAFKQSETETDGTNSTGWETFLGAVYRAGLALSGTWPIRTERAERSVSLGTNSLASSIILVCRPKNPDAPSISRRQFIRELNATLPLALDAMTRESEGLHSPVAPVDLSQAIIGPGMAVFSKYSAVLEADGSPMSVKTALQLINRFLAEDDFDADTQFCLRWFEQHHWDVGAFGEADVLARAKGTSVEGVRQSGVVSASGGKVRLIRPIDYPADWSPADDQRLPVWEALHQLIRALRGEGESGAGVILAAVAGQAEAVRQLAYRLYTLCERAGLAEDARAYNELVTSWAAVEAAAARAPAAAQQRMFGDER